MWTRGKQPCPHEERLKILKIAKQLSLARILLISQNTSTVTLCSVKKKCVAVLKRKKFHFLFDNTATQFFHRAKYSRDRVPSATPGISLIKWHFYWLTFEWHLLLNFNFINSINKLKWLFFSTRLSVNNAKFNSDQQKRQRAIHPLYIAECSCWYFSW